MNYGYCKMECVVVFLQVWLLKKGTNGNHISELILEKLKKEQGKQGREQTEPEIAVGLQKQKKKNGGRKKTTKKRKGMGLESDAVQQEEWKEGGGRTQVREERKRRQRENKSCAVQMVQVKI